MRFKSVNDLEMRMKKAKKAKSAVKKTILVCAGPGCRANGSLEVIDALRRELDSRGIDMKVEVVVKETGCHGFCEQGPLLTFEPSGLQYQRVSVKKVPEIVEKTIIGGKVIKSIVYRDPESRKYIEKYSNIPFYLHQTKIALRNSGHLDPASLDDYLAAGGFAGLAKALSVEPEAIVDEVEKSGLRGRGGGGFPTARNGVAALMLGAMYATLSAMAMRAIPALSWTARLWRVILSGCWRV